MPNKLLTYGLSSWLIMLRRIPNFFRFINDNGKNHGRVRGEEAFLICLARLTSTKPLHDLVADFGRDYSWISRSFDAFVRWTERVHGWRLYDNLANWLTVLPRFAEAIRCKLWGYGVEFDPGTFTIFSFIDCTNKLINRVGAGPERDGVGAPRADPAMMLQQLYYDGWLGSCGIKYESVYLPCGMDCFVSKGDSSRHSDLYFLRESDINRKLMDIQHHQFANPVGNNPAWTLYKTYGDSAFGHMECLQSRQRVAGVLQENLRMENVAMSRLRESIEWSYGETSKIVAPSPVTSSIEQSIMSSSSAVNSLSPAHNAMPEHFTEFAKLSQRSTSSIFIC